MSGLDEAASLAPMNTSTGGHLPEAVYPGHCKQTDLVDALTARAWNCMRDGLREALDPRGVLMFELASSSASGVRGLFSHMANRINIASQSINIAGQKRRQQADFVIAIECLFVHSNLSATR